MDVLRTVCTIFSRAVVETMQNKTCQLEPVPMWLMKEVCGLLSPFITLLWNKSLTIDCFPSKFKQAVVRPLLKTSELDSSQLKNYRTSTRVFSLQAAVKTYLKWKNI